jgi:hypothetical protein
LLDGAVFGLARPLRAKAGWFIRRYAEKDLKIVPAWDLLLQFHSRLRDRIRAAWKDDPRIHSLNRFTSIETRGR